MLSMSFRSRLKLKDASVSEALSVQVLVFCDEFRHSASSDSLIFNISEFHFVGCPELCRDGFLAISKQAYCMRRVLDELPESQSEMRYKKSVIHLQTCPVLRCLLSCKFRRKDV